MEPSIEGNYSSRLMHVVKKPVEGQVGSCTLSMQDNLDDIISSYHILCQKFSLYDYAQWSQQALHS